MMRRKKYKLKKDLPVGKKGDSVLLTQKVGDLLVRYNAASEVKARKARKAKKSKAKKDEEQKD